MKRLVLAIAAVIMISTTSLAQDNKIYKDRHAKKLDKTEMIQKRTDETVKKYGLNNKQAKKLLALNQKYADKMGPVPRGHHPHGGKPGMHPKHKDNQGPKVKGDSLKRRDMQRPPLTDEQRAKMEQQRKERGEVMKAYDAELATILTADQLKAYKADRQKMERHGHHGPKGPKPEK